MTSEEAQRLIAEGALVIDVRRVQDWRRAHIPGSIHIPLGELEGRADELPDDRMLLTFCTGGLLSSGAANLLAELGFEATNMARGLIDWRAAGGELVSGE
ncbi:rhodanese-like domain-containing protein [Microbacterium galbinum]|uniref:Rhodanese-like domain-containing protein n=1 Tax=Microbacterium galbinum TaxID=2851646 RepID=A0ABY4ITJ0_9MICO|nr:rhodanese-like domain-containing protein [Microbacterium galbinum]